MSWRKPLLIGAAVLAVIFAVGAYRLHAFKAGLPPACDNYLGVTAIQDFVATSPVGKASGLKLVKMTDIKEISHSDSELACAGTAHMNTSAAVPIDFQFMMKDGQRSIDAQW
jgi:hypothetical protein